MAFDRWQRKREEIDVNLIPVMNLFVTLIPFLLLAAAFYHVSVIPTSLPSQTSGESSVETDLLAVTVNVKITEESVEVSVLNPEIEEEVLDAVAIAIPKREQGYDLTLLGQGLFEIKRRYPNSDTVIVLPDEQVQYEDVVRVLDATREFVENEGKEDEKKTPLFPVVVLSRTV